jgi:hypothetical protein
VGQIPPYIPTDSLVGWWPFNGNANDESGNGNNGVLGVVESSTDRLGKPNSSFLFKGTGSITIPHSASLNSKEISISLWFVTTSTNNGSLIYKTSASAKNESYGCVIHYPTVNNTVWSVKNGNNCLKPGAGWKTLNMQISSISDGNWHHLICTYDGSVSKLYLDGSMIVEDTFTKGVIDNCAGEINIGKGYDDKYLFEGKIDDLAIWNRSLGIEEVNTIFNSLKSLKSIVSNKSDVSCNGGTDGSASIEVSGGIPPYSYNWNTVPPQTTKIATGLKAGTYEVSVSDSVGTLDTILVTISEPSPIIKPIIVGYAIICLDYPISTYTVDSKSGYNITWSTPQNGRIIGSNSRDSVVVEWLNSGIDTVYARYTDAQTGCYEETKKAVLIGNPLTPSIQGSASTCIDTIPVTYRTRFQAGQSYGWSKPRLGTIIGAINLDSVQIEWNASGQDTLILREFTIATGCFKDTSLIITINPRPQPSISGKSELVEYAQSNVYSVSNESGSSYEWSIVEGDAEIEKKNGNSIELKAGKSGIVIIKIIQTTSDGCKNEAQYTITVKSATGITESRSKSFSVYPNPNNGQEELIIELPSTSLHKMRIELIDLLGITRYEGMIPSQTSRHVIQLSDMPKGMYTIRLITRDGVLSEKVIVE